MSFEPAAQLSLLVAEPGSWSHSPLRRLVDDPLHGVILKHAAPAGDLQVGGQDETAVFIAVSDDLEQQPDAFRVKRKYPNSSIISNLFLANRASSLSSPWLSLERRRRITKEAVVKCRAEMPC